MFRRFYSQKWWREAGSAKRSSGYKEAFKKLQEIESPEEITADIVFNTAQNELRALNPRSLKSKSNEKVRAFLHQLKAEIAALETALGEAV